MTPMPFSTLRRRGTVAACALALAACVAAPHAAGPSAAQIGALLASPDRTAADRTNDIRRQPQALLAFIAPRPGMVALDVSAGGGYTTELLARVIGPTGRVYGQSQPSRPAGAPAPATVAPEGQSHPLAAAAEAASAPPVRMPPATAIANRAARLQAAQVAAAPMQAVVQPFDNPVPAAVAQQGLDLVTLMFNYHDLGHMGVDRTAMNRAIYQALKPGGSYVIGDHAGRPGTGISEAGTLHRVEEAFVRREVEAAGFRLAAVGDFLRNPNDPRDQNTPNPPQAKDEFVLKFVKP
jgi:predicted methyltransferase